MAEPGIPEGFDFTDPDLYVSRMPTEEFAELRRTAPVWWNAQPRGASGFDDEGYWVVTKHADVLELSAEFKRVATPEGRWAHYVNMASALGGEEFRVPGQLFGQYESALGTGQANVWFDLDD